MRKFRKDMPEHLKGSNGKEPAALANFNRHMKEVDDKQLQEELEAGAIKHAGQNCKVCKPLESKLDSILMDVTYTNDVNLLQSAKEKILYLIENEKNLTEKRTVELVLKAIALSKPNATIRVKWD